MRAPPPQSADVLPFRLVQGEDDATGPAVLHRTFSVVVPPSDRPTEVVLKVPIEDVAVQPRFLVVFRDF